MSETITYGTLDSLGNDPRFDNLEDAREFDRHVRDKGWAPTQVVRYVDGYLDDRWDDANEDELWAQDQDQEENDD